VENFFGAALGILLMVWLAYLGLAAAGEALVLSLAATLGTSIVLGMFLLAKTLRASSLASVISARWSDEEIQWSMDYDEVVRWSKANWLAVISAICGGVVAVKCFQESASFKKLIPPQQILGTIVTILALVGTGILIGKFFRWFAIHQVRGAIESRDRQATRCAEFLAALREAESSNDECSAKLGVMWKKFSAEIGEYVGEHREDLLQDMGFLEQSVQEALAKARADRRELEQAEREHGAAMSIFREASIAVNRTGGITLIKELEAIYEAMESDNMRGLLLDRKWNDYRAIQREVADDLKRLKVAAEKYEGAAFAPESPADDGTMTPSRAYKLLDAAPDMALADIKKIYRRKANDYHPDKAATTNEALRKLAEEHFKEINLAWAFVEANHP
jgi:DnaJ-domain-containing protein 1